MIANLFMFLVVVGLSFAAITLMASFIRFHFLTQRIVKATPDSVDPEDVFQLRVVQEMGAFHQVPTPFSVLLIEPIFAPDFEQSQQPEVVDTCREQWLAALRSMIRATDFAARFEGGLYGVLGRFPEARAASIAERIAHGLSRVTVRADGGLSFRWPARIGVASYPQHGERAADLIAQAKAALEESRGKTPGTVQLASMPVQNVAAPAAKESTTPSKNDTSHLLDPLTGVLRAERLGTALQKVVARQRKDGLGVSVAYLSIDLFQQYKDHYSQQATDTLVSGLANLLSERTRETDVLARVAECEFAVVMDCAPKAALEAAQRLVSDVKRMTFKFGTMNLKITVSAGVAGFPDHTGQGAQMLMYAEAAMLAARERGRNLSLLYQGDMRERRPDERAADTF